MYGSGQPYLCVTILVPGPEVYANHNAPPDVPLSAVIYALRAMVDKDIPLNQVRVCVLGVVISVDVGVDGWVGSWI